MSLDIGRIMAHCESYNSYRHAPTQPKMPKDANTFQITKKKLKIKTMSPGYLYTHATVV